jgi:Tol biopolymer transport system component
MELVAGETLADRLREGPLSIEEALGVATQVAEALEAAHEKGIIHRDLKPGNIKVKPDGSVKVLDFGLAKTVESADLLSNSPTFTAAASEAGLIIGTAAYMSPEQARGRTVDKRTDIWAFGCVLYQMLTGRQAFDGETVTDVLAAVVKNEPDWSALPSGTPRLLRSVLRRCLQKDPARRLHDIADARIEILEATSEPDAGLLQLTKSRPAWIAATPWMIAALLAGAVIWLAMTARGGPSLANSLPFRLDLNLPEDVELFLSTSSVAFSPSGSVVALVGIAEGNRQAYLFPLDRGGYVPIKGTEGASSLFFSPDGRSFGVVLPGVLARVSIDDGLVKPLATAADLMSGGAWGPDDVITFVRQGALWRVPAAGGTAKQLTTLDAAKHELSHSFPAVTPDGRVVFMAVATGGTRSETHIEAVSVDTGERHTVVESGTAPVWTPSGHLVFFRDSALLAMPFDPDRLEPTGPAVRVVSSVYATTFGSALFGVSTAGSLVYMSQSAATQLVWVSSENGAERRLSDANRPYMFPGLSKDASKVLFASDGHVSLLDIDRSIVTRLTTDATAANAYPVWTPDGKRAIFRASTGLHWVDAEGSGRTGFLPGTSANDYPSSVSSDGRWLAFLRLGGETSADVLVMSLDGTSKPRPLANTPAFEGGAQFSPDGKWVAFSSDEYGHFQVFIRAFDGPDRKWPVSQSGKYAKWNRNGRELFYRDGNKMMSVAVSFGPDGPILSAPRVLFDQRYQYGLGQTTANYDVTPDGKGFVMVKDQASSSRLNIVLKWFDELRRLAPVGQR